MVLDQVVGVDPSIGYVQQFYYELFIMHVQNK